jgi:hypothetical protein
MKLSREKLAGAGAKTEIVGEAAAVAAMATGGEAVVASAVVDVQAGVDVLTKAYVSKHLLSLAPKLAYARNWG